MNAIIYMIVRKSVRDDESRVYVTVETLPAGTSKAEADEYAQSLQNIRWDRETMYYADFADLT